jgi:hypothetical protein
MSPPEMLHRLWQKCRRPLVNRAIMNERVPAALDDVIATADASLGLLSVDDASRPLDPDYETALRTQADDVCARRITLFDTQLDLGRAIVWRRDYYSGLECPLARADKLNYRNPEKVGDIMYIWWLNRHQHLVPVALAYFVTEEPRYAEEVVAQLSSWLEQSPYPMGPAWMTGIEAGIRLITWSWLYRFMMVKGRPAACTDIFLAEWFRSIRQHVHYINTHWSRYSSANNHIIAEAVGILSAVCTWPGLFPEGNLATKCQHILRRQVARQVSHDGVNQEQSTSYHAYVLEVLLNACIFHAPTRQMLRARLLKSADFLSALAWGVSEAPDFGDNDSAVASGILPRSPDYYNQVVIATRAVLSDMSPPRNQRIASPVYWYGGCNHIDGDAPFSGDFSGGGYVIWNGHITNGMPLKLAVDVGPLGYGSLAAHGHADPLSFTLHVDGEPVFIDPGTYCYHNEPEWRTYFRSLRAHNSFRLNDIDEQQMLGPFLWGKKYRAYATNVVIGEDQLYIEAEHDAYLMSEPRAIHRRQFTWHPLLRKWIIQDEIIGNKTWNIELLFHVHPDRQVTRRGGNVFVISGARYDVVLQLSSHLRARIAQGETDPPLGWYSPVLGKKLPCPTIIGTANMIGNDNLFTEFRIDCRSTEADD